MLAPNFLVIFLTNTSTLDQLQALLLSSFLLSLLLYYLSYENPENLLRQRDTTAETLSMYECGFEPFKEPQEFFFIQYFSIAILFLLFDLEFIFLIPWILAPAISLISHLLLIMLFFFAIVLGLYLEWRAESLNWIKIQNI